MRIVRRFFQFCLLLAVILLLATFIPRAFFSGAKVTAEPAREILVLANPIHTDIALPLDDDLRARFAFAKQANVPVDHPGAAYLVIGWGGRSFYLETPTWGDLQPMPVVRALTLDRSVMHLDLAGEKLRDSPHVTHLRIDQAGYYRMLAFIDASFTRNGEATMAIPGASYGKYDAFFEAKGSFNAFFGCNTWTARALRKAGLRTGLWNPLPQTLALSLSLYN